jgi:hypothetical protein
MFVAVLPDSPLHPEKTDARWLEVDPMKDLSSSAVKRMKWRPVLPKHGDVD